MSRYFFHVEDGQIWRDDEGVELPDDGAAIEEGVRAAGGMIADLAGDLDLSAPWHMAIVEQSGRP